jgi:hypothetical protein
MGGTPPSSTPKVCGRLRAGLGWQPVGVLPYPGVLSPIGIIYDISGSGFGGIARAARPVPLRVDLGHQLPQPLMTWSPARRLSSAPLT